MGVTPCSAPPFALRATPDDVVRQLRHLPSAPRVLPKLKRLLSDGNSSVHDIVALVRLDPGIAARVLQVGNSAFYSQGLRCYTVDEAVYRVGYDQIYELVSVAVASQVLVQPLAAYGMEADELWQSSIACAIAAECLAERLNIDRDISYTVGLLHRVGMVAVNEWLARTDPGVSFQSTGLPFETCEHERRVLGFHNAEAGAALLRLWEFPAVMAEPVRWQYLPSATAAHAQLATLLHLAKWVRTVASDEQTKFPLPEPSILRRVAINAPQLGQIVTKVRERMRDIGELLEDSPVERRAIQFPAGERFIAAS